MKMPLFSFQYLLVFALSILIGVFATPTSNESGSQAPGNADPHLEAQAPSIVTTQTPEVKLPESSCGPWIDEVSLEPILRRWLRGEEIRSVAYCSQTAVEAKGFNPSNVIPQVVDLNEDGIDELALRYSCSPTGNCSMKIYQRVGSSYRQIFADRQMVQYFDKVGAKHSGFRDIRTRLHGSCCDGDQVVYRFNGKKYAPISCSSYSYINPQDRSSPLDRPIVRNQSCRQALDPK